MAEPHERRSDDPRLDEMSRRLTHVEDSQREMRWAQKELSLRIEQIDNGNVEILRRIDRLGEAMAENTQITTVVRDGMATGRVLTKFAKWAGWMGAAFVGVWQALEVAWKQGWLK